MPRPSFTSVVSHLKTSLVLKSTNDLLFLIFSFFFWRKQTNKQKKTTNWNKIKKKACMTKVTWCNRTRHIAFREKIYTLQNPCLFELIRIMTQTKSKNNWFSHYQIVTNNIYNMALEVNYTIHHLSELKKPQTSLQTQSLPFHKDALVR